MRDGVDVSVVIVSWNVRRLLLDCVKSLFATRGDLSVEVCVVDNGSTDGSADTIRREYPLVNVIVNEENRGFAAANNQGIRLARGRYVLLLNPDTLWLDDSLRRLVRFMDDHPEVGAAGPQLLDADGMSIQYWGARRLPTPLDTLIEYSKLDLLFPRSRFCTRYLMADWDHTDSREVECISGACLLVRRETIADVGGLDEGFQLYSEDTDWCHRIGLKQWQIHYLAEARLIHVGRQSSLQNRGQATVNAVRGAYRYHRRFYGLAAVLMLWVAMWLVSIAKLIAWSMIRLFGARDRNLAAGQVKAYWNVCKLFPLIRRV